VNHLVALGKHFDTKELNITILKSLNRYWQSKVTTISKLRDLTTMNMTTIFGKIREHELELGRLKYEKEERNKKSIPLKVNSRKLDDDSYGENMNFMVNKFFS